MTRKVFLLISVLVILGIAGLGVAETANLNQAARFASASAKDGSVDIQLQIPTPTSQVVDVDESTGPVLSEAGKDTGIVAGAAVLMLIVIGGLIIGRRHQPPPVTRD